LQTEKKIKPYKNGQISEKPYRFFGDYLWSKYGCRVLKLPINAGFGCPNRNIKPGNTGCIYCSDDGSASPSIKGISDIKLQMSAAKNNFDRIDVNTRFIAYFQAFTNTNAAVKILKETYDAAVRSENVIGLMIGTRPDCLSDEILDLISGYMKDQFELWLEIGMQSMHNPSLEFLKRGHDHRSTLDSVKRARMRNIPVCLHIILGIPGETWNDMMDTALEINRLEIQGIKFHHLHVIQNTALSAIYKSGHIKLLTMDEYVSTLCDFIERLSENIIIHRIAGDRSADSLVAPSWGLHKGTVIKAVNDEFKKRGTRQGFLYNDQSFFFFPE
jgi:hypothetical protein